MDSEGLFRFGIASVFLVAVLDVVVAWALFMVFKPVSSGLSLLAAGFRVGYAGIFMVAIGQLVEVLHILTNPGYLGVYSVEQLHRRRC